MEERYIRIHRAIALLLLLWCGYQAWNMLSGRQYGGAADAIYAGLAHMKLLDMLAGALAAINAALFAAALFRVKMMQPALIMLAAWMAGHGAGTIIISSLAPNAALAGRLAAVAALLILYRRRNAHAK